jgi:hypothetical protein
MALFGFGGGAGGKPVPPAKAPAQPDPRGVVGHRGIAAGSLAPGQQDLSAENLAKWRNLHGDAVAGFVFEGEPLFVHSSNVAMAQYHLAEGKIMIEYLNGEAWLYGSVSASEALDFAKAQSKGGWLWDNVRVRGTKHDHKKPATQVK